MLRSVVGDNGPMPADDVTASLLVMADHVDRYHEQVGDLVPRFVAEERSDATTALVEAERALRTAVRLLRRAAKAIA